VTIGAAPASFVNEGTRTMSPDALPQEALLERLERLARAALPAFGLDPGSTVTMINHSENTTYRVDDPAAGAPTILRVHREGYHSRNAINCELAWMSALRKEAGVITPTPIPGVNGELIQEVPGPGLNPRHCVLFEFLEGVEPSEDELLGSFHRLGEISGYIHRHSETWRRPANFERLHWDFEHMLGGSPYWGDWRAGPALDAERLALLERLTAVIGRRLEAYGKAADRFGLVHADLRLANLLIHEDETRVIDFDDSGLSWFLYDLATALSFIEEREDVPELIRIWVEGYRKVRPLSDADEAEIPTFLMLRRMVILAWIGSHSETDLAKELGPEYTAGTCRLAERYLADFA